MHPRQTEQHKKGRNTVCHRICLMLSCLMLAGCGTAKDKLDVSEDNLSQAEMTNKTQAQTDDNTLGAVETEIAPDAVVSQDVFAMDTYMTVTAYGAGADQAVTDAIEEINRLDALLSTGQIHSEVAELNEQGGSKSLSTDTAYLFSRALDLYQDTDGVFDIAIYPIMKAWGFAGDTYQVPSETELQELLQHIDADQISFSEEERQVSFLEEGMAVDFGGIAKGYISARIMDIFREAGLHSGVVNLGGNVQVYGTKPDGSFWKVGIQVPWDSDGYLGIVSVADQAVITSGGYERFFEQDGVIYHHIIDPTTGYPADSGLVSATVISTDGTLADGLSTTLFIMGEEKAEAYWRKHPEWFDMMLLTEDGTLYVTEGIAEQVTSGYPITIITK